MTVVSEDQVLKVQVNFSRDLVNYLMTPVGRNSDAADAVLASLLRAALNEAVKVEEAGR